MFKNHFIHSQKCIKKFLRILHLFKMAQCIKIDLYTTQTRRRTFMHRIVQNFFKRSASLINGPVRKNWFIPMTHERKDALYVQNCTKNIIGPWRMIKSRKRAMLSLKLWEMLNYVSFCPTWKYLRRILGKILG